MVHRKELVEQAAKHCALAYPNKTIEIEMGSSHASGTADITIASIRSLVSGDRIYKYDQKKFKLALVDEAHHIVTPTYEAALSWFRLSEKFKKEGADSPVLVGVSATFSRFDGLKLGAAIDHIVYHKDYIDMIGEKWLADAIFTTVKSHVDLSKVGDGPNGDFRMAPLSDAVNTTATNDIIVTSWHSRARDRKSTLVFCVDIDHVKALTDKFREYGIDARYITSQTPLDVRLRELESFKNLEFPVLVNCGLFTEGTDIPNIDCVVLARPTRSKNLLVQMIGRGLRLYPGKENCHIIDMVGSLDSGVLTTPTLFGLHPDEGLDKTSAEECKKLREFKEKEDAKPKPKPTIPEEDMFITFAEYDSVHEFLRDVSGEEHIRSISEHAWVQINHQKYVLSGPSGRITIVKDKESGLYSVRHVIALPASAESKSPFSRPNEVASSLEFEQAVHAADTLARRVFLPVFIASWQPWRWGRATLMQMRMLRSRLGNKTPEKLSKGEAADMITKLKNGARGQYMMFQAAKRRMVKKMEKDAKREEAAARENVKVGPLA